MLDNYIKKEDLKDRTYYKGECRNADYGIWIAEIERFIYMRTKFYDIFPETICCPEDDERYDIFYAEKEVEIKDIPELTLNLVPEKEIIDRIEYETTLRQIKKL